MSGDLRSRTSGSFVVVAIICLTMTIVLAVIYLVYVFIDLTHVSNAANVHVTKSLTLAARKAQGNLYSNPEKGISNWVVSADKLNGYEIKYPDNLLVQRQPDSGEHSLALKKFNLGPKGADSLLMAIYVDSETVSDKFSLRDEIKEKGLTWDENWRQQEIGGRPGIRTGVVRDEYGVSKELILWQFGGKIFMLEADYFNTDSSEGSELFEKIVSEFKFV
jgi:hypothetical protein